MNNWMPCKWVIVVGQIRECEFCGMVAKVPTGQANPTCENRGKKGTPNDHT